MVLCSLFPLVSLGLTTTAKHNTTQAMDSTSQVLPSYDIASLFFAIYDEDSFAAVMMKMIPYKSDTDYDDDSANDEAAFAIAVIYKYISTSYQSPSVVIMKTTALYTSYSM